VHTIWLRMRECRAASVCRRALCRDWRQLGFERAFAPAGCSISTISSDAPLSRRGALLARLEVAKGCASSCGFRFAPSAPWHGRIPARRPRCSPGPAHMTARLSNAIPPQERRPFHPHALRSRLPASIDRLLLLDGDRRVKRRANGGVRGGECAPPQCHAWLRVPLTWSPHPSPFQNRKKAHLDTREDSPRESLGRCVKTSAALAVHASIHAPRQHHSHPRTLPSVPRVAWWRPQRRGGWEKRESGSLGGYVRVRGHHATACAL
jgi:hypothetical protein